MRTKKEFCHKCKGPREQTVLGFMPVMFTEDRHRAEWKKSLVCNTCGDINYEPVNNDEIDRAHKRYLKTLLELGIETEESIKEKTGVTL